MGGTLLLVEDDVLLAESLARLLRRHFTRVVVTASYAAGLAALEAEAFDVVLSDYSLGDGDGVALLTRAAARWPVSRRVLYSGNARALATAAAHAIVDKSAPMQVLLAALIPDV